MKAVFQRVTDHDPINGQIGDCFRAATASILELNLDEVPHFAELCAPDFEAEHFWRVVDEWFFSRGLELKFCAPVSIDELRSNNLAGRYHFVFGRCIHRGGVVGHTLVGFDGLVVHDPDNTKHELVYGAEAFGYLITRDGLLFG